MKKKAVSKKASAAKSADTAKQTAAELEASIKGNQLAGIDTATALKGQEVPPPPAAKPTPPPAPPKPPALVEEVILDRYEFTDAEKLALGSGLAQGHSQIAGLKEELKSVTTDYKGKIQKIEAAVNSATEKINSGFEMKSIECVVLHQRKVDKGQSAWKAYYRKDTGAFVRKEPMTSSDFALLNCEWPAGHKIESPYFPPKPDEKK